MPLDPRSRPDFSPTIEAAENGFMVKPPYNSTMQPVICETIHEAIGELSKMVVEAWNEQHKMFMDQKPPEEHENY